MADAGAPLSFRLPNALSVKLCVRFGCLGAAALSGRFVDGGIVTSSNPLVCGNKSSWWGFAGVKNVDGLLRKYAGPDLARECEELALVGPDGQRLLPGTALATGAHALPARHVLHAAGPTSQFPPPESERILRQTFERCLVLAMDLSLSSLALPAIGCGVAGFPPAVGARAALDAVEQAFMLVASEEDEDSRVAGAAPHGLRLLEFVLADEQVYAAFADLAHMRYSQRAKQ